MGFHGLLLIDDVREVFWIRQFVVCLVRSIREVEGAMPRHRGVVLGAPCLHDIKDRDGTWSSIINICITVNHELEVSLLAHFI